MKKKISIITMVAMLISLVPTFAFASYSVETPKDNLIGYHCMRPGDDGCDDDGNTEYNPELKNPHIQLGYYFCLDPNLKKVRMDIACLKDGDATPEDVFKPGYVFKEGEVIYKGIILENTCPEAWTSHQTSMDNHFVYYCLRGVSGKKISNPIYGKFEFEYEKSLTISDEMNQNEWQSLQLKSAKVSKKKTNKNRKLNVAFSFKKNKSKANKYLVEIKNKKTGKSKYKLTSSKKISLKGYKKGQKISVKVRPIKKNGHIMVEGKSKAKTITLK